jgi:hypothetical protein
MLSARWSRPTHGLVPPWPPPSSLATSIAAISGTPRCAQLWWTHRYPCPHRSCHQRRATVVALLPSPVLSLTSGVRVSAATRGREPTTGHTREAAASCFWAALACAGAHVTGRRGLLGQPEWEDIIRFCYFLFLFNVLILVQTLKFHISSFRAPKDMVQNV